ITCVTRPVSSGSISGTLPLNLITISVAASSATGSAIIYPRDLARFTHVDGVQNVDDRLLGYRLAQIHPQGCALILQRVRQSVIALRGLHFDYLKLRFIGFLSSRASCRHLSRHANIRIQVEEQI